MASQRTGSTSAQLVQTRREAQQPRARASRPEDARSAQGRLQHLPDPEKRPTSRQTAGGTRYVKQPQPAGASQRRPAAASGMTTQHLSERTTRKTRSNASHAASHGDARGGRKRHSKKPVVATVIILLVVLGGVFFLCRRFIGGATFDLFGERSHVAAGQEVTVTIPDGAGGSEIMQTLLDAGVIDDSKAFQQAVQAQNADQKLKSGSYSFLTGSDPMDVVKQLMDGPNATQNVLTLAEGLTVSQTADAVQSALGISRDDFVNQAKASNYVADYPFLADAGNDSLEGFLYASRYDFNGKEVTADSVIRAMLDQYQANIASLDFDSARGSLQARYPNLSNWTNYDILTLASIIDKESLSSSDRYNVSSVFYNRMNSGMPLQSDTTMGYVTGGTVTEEDNHADSPYNTYDRQGVPPTPICSPRLESVQAALNPAQTDYYYFWITQTESVFSETYEQHQQVIANATQ